MDPGSQMEKIFHGEGRSEVCSMLLTGRLTMEPDSGEGDLDMSH